MGKVDMGDGQGMDALCAEGVCVMERRSMRYVMGVDAYMEGADMEQ